MAFVVLSILFLGTGVLSLYFTRIVPPTDELRRRLPNRGSVAGIVLAVVIGVAIWYIVTHTNGFTRAASITTLLFFLLLFESLFLVAMRIIRSNIRALLAALGVAVIPFVIQYYAPSFFLTNAIIIFATMGATTLVVKMNYLRTRVVMLMAVLLTINDILNVRFLLPKLNLVPVSEPLRLLIFPTVTYGGHVVGSGDFMYLVFLTLVMMRDFGRRQAFLLVVFESLGLLVTGLAILNRDILLPFLTVMTPIFLGVYWYAYRQRKKRVRSDATVGTAR